MKNVFEAHFQSLREKGAWADVESYNDLTAEQKQELASSYLSELRDKALNSQKQVEDLQAKYDKSEEQNEEEKAALKAQIEGFNTELKELTTLQMQGHLELSKALSNMSVNDMKRLNFAPSTEQQKAKAIAEVKSLLKEVHEAAKNGEKLERVIKADTLTTSVQNSTRGMMDPDVTRLAHRRLNIADAIPRQIIIPENMGGTYQYLEVNSTSSVRAAATVAEGGAFPESTIVYTEQFLKLKKIADFLPYSDEFAYDYANLMVTISEFLLQNINLEKDDQIINGDNTGANWKGMLTSIPAYTPVASSVADANVYDLFCLVSENITATEGSKYQPNVIVMNSTDIVGKMSLKKDADNNYIPIKRMLEEKGFTVIENNSLAANSAILGDIRYASLLMGAGITLRTNVKVNNNELEGISNVAIETRGNLLIKEEEKTGWRKVTDINAALTTIGL